jgi:hypothetical protein
VLEILGIRAGPADSRAGRKAAVRPPLRQAKHDCLEERWQIALRVDHEMNENGIVADLINDPVFPTKGLPETVLEEALKLGRCMTARGELANVRDRFLQLRRYV